LERLLQFNIGQKLQIQNLEDELHRDQEEWWIKSIETLELLLTVCFNFDILIF
jgi:hypothetical protein